MKKLSRRLMGLITNHFRELDLASVCPQANLAVHHTAKIRRALKTISALRQMNDSSQMISSDSALENIAERDVTKNTGKGQLRRKPCSIIYTEAATEGQNACKKGWSCCSTVPNTKTVCCACCSSEEKQRLQHSRKLCHMRRTCLCKDAKLKESTVGNGSGTEKGPEKQSRGSSAERVLVKSMESVTDELDIDKLQQDLQHERTLRAQLAEQIKNLTCSMQCLKADGEQQAACLRDALSKAEEQVKLAVRSQNLAMDLAKQSRNHSDMIKASKSDLAAQMTVLKVKRQTICDNTKLACECKDLKYQLKSMSETEAKKFADVSLEVDKIKNAVQRKEEILYAEKAEYEEMIAELTNVVKIQKKQICDLTGICNQHQIQMQQKDMCISEKDAQQCDQQCKLNTMVSKVKELKMELENSKFSLAQETQTCNTLRKELINIKDNHHCELRIKEQMIEDQSDTIKRLKNLVQQSEKMAKHAAQEFEQLTDQLYCEKETNNSLLAALETAESKFADQPLGLCKNCEELGAQMDCLEDQKRKALQAAKFAADKFFKAKIEFEHQLQEEKQQQQYLKMALKKRENEIDCLKANYQHRKQVDKRNRSIH
ncbi:myosin-16-like [Athalia rosae]|uniref:myosin-16-like n=1 Tax=Athalia rosae TaxID=37344 RepID=UPI002034537B|nr:myosin-16-like [Athalia rosae]